MHMKCYMQRKRVENPETFKPSVGKRTSRIHGNHTVSHHVEGHQAGIQSFKGVWN